MIRDHVTEMTGKLTALGETLSDEVPNGQEYAKIGGEVLGIVTEAPDFVGMPQGDRLKAVGLAFAQAGAAILGKAIKFSDDIPA